MLRQRAGWLVATVLSWVFATSAWSCTCMPSESDATYVDVINRTGPIVLVEVRQPLLDSGYQRGELDVLRVLRASNDLPLESFIDRIRYAFGTLLPSPFRKRIFLSLEDSCSGSFEEPIGSRWVVALRAHKNGSFDFQPCGPSPLRVTNGIAEARYPPIAPGIDRLPVDELEVLVQRATRPPAPF